MGAVWVIVVAAGEGRRFGAAKQYAPLAGRRVLDWSLDAARTVADGVVLVVPPDRAGDAEPQADAVAAGAATRSGSVRAGLDRVPAGAEVVVVHDGARPLAGPDLFGAVVDAVRAGADAAVPGVPVSDTLRSRGGGVVDRHGVVAVQTPQAFRAAALRAAHAGGAEATDDASLVEAGGGKVVVVDGSPANLKITDPADLVVAEALLGAG
jgi:2-C-methyl-D-erythritol 4-phosphate cytidylyltransferase